MKSTRIIQSWAAKAEISEKTRDRSGAEFPHICSDKGTTALLPNASFTEFAFKSITLEYDEAQKEHVNVGNREKQISFGPLGIKGTIKRNVDNGYWMGMSKGSVLQGHTYVETAYVNDIIGDGSGYVDDAEVNAYVGTTGVGVSNLFYDTSATWGTNRYTDWYLYADDNHFVVTANDATGLTVSGTPTSGPYTITRIPLEKPWFELKITEDKGKQPLVTVLKSMFFTKYSQNPTAGEAIEESIDFVATTEYGTFPKTSATFS